MMICLLFFTLAGAGCSEKKEAPLSNVTSEVGLKETGEPSREESYDEKEPASMDEEEGLTGEPGNVPPKITSLKLTPILVYPGTTVKALAEAIDEDGAYVTFYYRWKKNGDFIPDEEADELDTSDLKKGEIVTAFVTPYDGEVRGDEEMSPSVLIANRPPEITSTPVGKVLEGVYSYQVKATDPEEDVLTFSLETSPEGMIIDSASGLIEWKLPKNSKDAITVKVVVSDGDASAYQAFNLTPGK